MAVGVSVLVTVITVANMVTLVSEASLPNTVASAVIEITVATVETLRFVDTRVAIVGAMTALGIIVVCGITTVVLDVGGTVVNAHVVLAVVFG